MLFIAFVGTKGEYITIMQLMLNISPCAPACNLPSDSCFPSAHFLLINIPDKPKSYH